jgi:hypothetical protein
MMLLAEANIAQMRYPLEDPRMAGFRDNLARVNGEAARAPGFVWQLQSEAGDSTGIRVFDDPLCLINVSVWNTLEALLRFSYSGVHGEFFRRRAEWFDPPRRPPVALWWIEQATRPTAEDSRRRLERLWQDGATPAAFSFQQAYDASGALLPAGWRRRLVVPD